MHFLGSLHWWQGCTPDSIGKAYSTGFEGAALGQGREGRGRDGNGRR